MGKHAGDEDDVGGGDKEVEKGRRKMDEKKLFVFLCFHIHSCVLRYLLVTFGDCFNVDCFTFSGMSNCTKLRCYYRRSSINQDAQLCSLKMLIVDEMK